MEDEDPGYPDLHSAEWKHIADMKRALALRYEFLSMTRLPGSTERVPGTATKMAGYPQGKTLDPHSVVGLYERIPGR